MPNMSEFCNMYKGWKIPCFGMAKEVSRMHVAMMINVQGRCSAFPGVGWD